MLFLLYVNDLVDVLTDDAEMKLYADDVKLYSSMPSNVTSSNDLQTQLNNLLQWSLVWQLPISYIKCCVLNIGKRNLDGVPLLLGQHILPNVDDVVDLGVVIDNNLKFSYHVNKIVG